MASSVGAYGFLYAPKLWSPDYLPLDENHPSAPRDPYALSKVFGEQVADSFVAISNLTAISLRLAGINFDLAYQILAQRQKDQALRAGNFWSYLDPRDAAVAFRLAVETDLKGHEVFNIAAPRSRMREPTEELIQRFFPGVTIVGDGLNGNWSGIDSSKAERILGFKAQHGWENYLKG